MKKTLIIVGITMIATTTGVLLALQPLGTDSEFSVIPKTLEPESSQALLVTDRLQSLTELVLAEQTYTQTIEVSQPTMLFGTQMGISTTALNAVGKAETRVDLSQVEVIQSGSTVRLIIPSVIVTSHLDEEATHTLYANRYGVSMADHSILTEHSRNEALSQIKQDACDPTRSLVQTAMTEGVISFQQTVQGWVQDKNVEVEVVVSTSLTLVCE